MSTLATAMRAASVADCMTKYLSKAQEALGPVMQPFIAGMRRIATAESAKEAAESTLVQRARRRIRRFIFSANRAMWFSACELGIFLTTGDSYIKTEATTKVFSVKGIAMMHERKRLLNHSTAAEGLLLARKSTQRTQATSMDAFLVPEPPHSDTDADSDAAEHGTQHDDHGDPTVVAHDEDATEHAVLGAATEHAHGHLAAVTTGPPRKTQRRQCTPQARRKCSPRAWRIEMTGCIVALCFAIWITTTMRALWREWRCP